MRQKLASSARDLVRKCPWRARPANLIVEVSEHRGYDIVPLSEVPGRDARPPSAICAMLSRMAYQRSLPQSWKELLADVRDFIDPLVTEADDRVLAERSVISLSPNAAQAFSDALAQPAAVNERLAAALGRPRGFRWVD
jgi:hypothetical protein